MQKASTKALEGEEGAAVLRSQRWARFDGEKRKRQAMGREASHTTDRAAGTALDATDNIPPLASITPRGCRKNVAPLDLQDM